MNRFFVCFFFLTYLEITVINAVEQRLCHSVSMKFTGCLDTKNG